MVPSLLENPWCFIYRSAARLGRVSWPPMNPTSSSRHQRNRHRPQRSDCAKLGRSNAAPYGEQETAVDKEPGAIDNRDADEILRARLKMASKNEQAAKPIRMVIADVDGTLVTQEKVLTKRAVEAVTRLHEAGIQFTVTSGRPPRGMAMLIDPLKLTQPLAAFNGGVLIQPDLKTVVDQKFPPTVVKTFAGLLGRVAKIVGVSDDLDRVAQCEKDVQQAGGTHISAARSQPYYLDVTHPQANKGEVALSISRVLNIPAAEIATIGDMPNDVLMFKKSGLSIAMGNASPEVQASATYVTTSNEEEGFANAIEKFVLNVRSAKV